MLILRLLSRNLGYFIFLSSLSYGEVLDEAMCILSIADGHKFMGFVTSLHSVA